jgi:hypothetical protein
MNNESASVDKSGFRKNARDLQKKNTRLVEGRNALKGKNKEKAKSIKKLRGNLDDIRMSRDLWKNQYQQASEANKSLKAEFKYQSELLSEVGREKIMMDEQLIKLQKMCDELKKMKK